MYMNPNCSVHYIQIFKIEVNLFVSFRFTKYNISFQDMRGPGLVELVAQHPSWVGILISPDFLSSFCPSNIFHPGQPVSLDCGLQVPCI